MNSHNMKKYYKCPRCKNTFISYFNYDKKDIPNCNLKNCFEKGLINKSDRIKYTKNRLK